MFAVAVFLCPLLIFAVPAVVVVLVVVIYFLKQLIVVLAELVVVPAVGQLVLPKFLLVGLAAALVVLIVTFRYLIAALLE